MRNVNINTDHQNCCQVIEPIYQPNHMAAKNIGIQFLNAGIWFDWKLQQQGARSILHEYKRLPQFLSPLLVNIKAELLVVVVVVMVVVVVAVAVVVVVMVMVVVTLLRFTSPSLQIFNSSQECSNRFCKARVNIFGRRPCNIDGFECRRQNGLIVICLHERTVRESIKIE
ncbi:hypothetical protein GQX74_001526 [Glossina fuscipes]|nr:hypothetical protein GQX74_001526 [Glossina fuscipes]